MLNVFLDPSALLSMAPGKGKMRSAPSKQQRWGLEEDILYYLLLFFQPFHSTVFIISLQIPSTCLLSFLSRPKLLVLYLKNDFWFVGTLFLVFLSFLDLTVKLRREKSCKPRCSCHSVSDKDQKFSSDSFIQLLTWLKKAWSGSLEAEYSCT